MDEKILNIAETSELMLSPLLDSLLWPSCRPSEGSAWHGHVSFGHWLVQAIRPRIIVELGTHMGVSFASFCNAVRQSKMETKCYAVDTWEGDAHSGFYDDDVYLDLQSFIQNNFASIASLIRRRFDDALQEFAAGTIDLLHIDGLHTYEAVKHDFEAWLSKMSPKGAIIFHDTDVFENDFGVWKLWDEISPKYPHFRFTHSSGLGVIAVGLSPTQPISWLCGISKIEEIDAVRQKFLKMSDFALLNGRQQIKKDLENLVSHLGRNIALHCFATQSSSDAGQVPTPQNAVDGVMDRIFAFHTEPESNPWWMVDFGSEKIFDHILVYNRLDGPCRHRARTLTVLISLDGLNWTKIYAHDGTLFGGVDGFPLHIKCSATRGRFVRIQLNETNFLHLVQVAIYAAEAM